MTRTHTLVQAHNSLNATFSRSYCDERTLVISYLHMSSLLGSVQSLSDFDSEIYYLSRVVNVRRIQDSFLGLFCLYGGLGGSVARMQSDRLNATSHIGYA